MSATSVDLTYTLGGTPTGGVLFTPAPIPTASGELYSFRANAQLAMVPEVVPTLVAPTAPSVSVNYNLQFVNGKYQMTPIIVVVNPNENNPVVDAPSSSLTDAVNYSLQWDAAGGKFVTQKTIKFEDATPTANSNYILTWNAATSSYSLTKNPKLQTLTAPSTTARYNLKWNATTATYDLVTSLVEDTNAVTRDGNKAYGLVWGGAVNHFNIAEVPRIAQTTLPGNGLTYALNWNAASAKYDIQKIASIDTSAMVDNSHYHFRWENSTSRLVGVPDTNNKKIVNGTTVVDGSVCKLAWDATLNQFTAVSSPSVITTAGQSLTNNKFYTPKWSAASSVFTPTESMVVKPTTSLANTGTYTLQWSSADNQFTPKKHGMIGNANFTNNHSYNFTWNSTEASFDSTRTHAIKYVAAANNNYYTLKWDGVAQEFTPIKIRPIDGTTGTVSNNSYYGLRWNSSINGFNSYLTHGIKNTGGLTDTGSYTLQWSSANGQFTPLRTRQISPTGVANNNYYSLKWETASNSFVPYSTYAIARTTLTNNDHYVLKWGSNVLTPTVVRPIVMDGTVQGNSDNMQYTLIWNKAVNAFYPREARRIAVTNLTNDAHYTLKWNSASDTLEPNIINREYTLGVSHETGETVDGKKVWTRYFTTTSPTGTASTDITMDTNVWMIVDYGGTIRRGSTQWHMIQDSFTTTDDHNSIFFLNSNKLHLYLKPNMFTTSYQDRSMRLWVKYVKS